MKRLPQSNLVFPKLQFEFKRLNWQQSNEHLSSKEQIFRMIRENQRQFTQVERMQLSQFKQLQHSAQQEQLLHIPTKQVVRKSHQAQDCTDFYCWVCRPEKLPRI